MSRAIDVEKAIEIIETKQKELCPVGRYGRNYVYGSDREKYDAWDEIIDVLENLPTLTPPNEWVSVEERLPEDEARQYIEDELDGIGYLYPCLLTYKSPNTERIHVVRFYYDIIQKWFVNNGEELCEKGRCIAWMPLPAPYDRRPPEGEA